MKKLQMKLCGDLVLREKCAPVENITPKILDMLRDMTEMMDEQSGVGLAAPQVGIPLRFIVMKEVKDRKDPGISHKMLNPKIISKSEKTCVIEEGCLSVLGSNDLPIYADVERPESVTAEWTDETGVRHRKEFDGLTSRIIQHEIDHLDGILFIDYLSPVKREMVMRKIRKRKA
ncbi:MAG: peptide deformylase [Alphaproteobacteria bacterium]|nr:peptide deformylase [Alphaproteobacteria bacterium]